MNVRDEDGFPPFRRKLANRVVLQRLRQADGLALLVSLLALAGLAMYRFYNYWTTGFFVSDEYGYFYYAIHGQIYSERWFFGGLNIALFRLLGVGSVDGFSYLLPFYIFFWSGLTLLVFHKTLKVLGFDQKTVAVSVISCFTLISFILLSLGFLTEPVGLCTAMIGIYFLARFMRSNTLRALSTSGFLAALFFAFAAGSREPYNALLIGSIVVVIFLAFKKRSDVSAAKGLTRRATLIIPVVIITITSLFFLQYPYPVYVQQVAPLSTDIAQSVITNPTYTPPVTIRTSTITSVYTTIGANNLTTTTTSTTTVSATVTLPQNNIAFYRASRILNTFLIFLGGIPLGWGPICAVLSAIGFVMILRRLVYGRDVISGFLFLISLIALGSYFVVSYIYAVDPYYFSLQNYSTMIRFSDTALPAYFMTAPVFLAIISKNRKRIFGLAAVAVVFLLVLVPVYEVYAASNFNYTGENPFQLGYKTDAALIRDYIAANSSQQPFNLVGVPYGWAFTPGVEDLHSLHSFALGPSPLFPHLVASNFTSMRWPAFYLYSTSPSAVQREEPFFGQFLNATLSTNQTSSQTFTFAGKTAVLKGQDFTLYRIELKWP